MIIYASNGRQKADIPVDDNSTQVMELQGDNVLNLSFTLYEYVALEVNDYSEYMGRRYWLMERPRPEQVSTVEWKYDIKLYGIESLVKRFLVLHDTDGADEAVFTLTAPAREHVALVVASVNRGMGSGDWKVGMVEATGNLVIDYRGTFCHDALRQIAAQAGPRVEWWVEGQTVNLCRCEQGEEVTLAYDTGLTSLSCSTAEGFYTRLYPIGSSRNIDPQKYGHSRLQLPGGVKHVDVGVERYGVWHRFETDAFAAIYPRYIGTVTSVRREERKDKEGRSFTAWFFSDSSLPFDPNAYEIGGRVKRVSFQEGAELAGLGSEEDGTYYFEANFDSRTREWELITLWPHDDDTQLPGGQLVPKPGDRYIPWNIRMPDEYYPLAEREFREAVDRYNTEHAVDAAVYKALTDYLYLEEHDITLRLGSRVRLESAQYFPDTGFRCSRVTKITRRINRPSRMELEMSDARPAGMMESLHEDIADARRLVYRMTDGLPDVVRTNDSTPPSDSNVLSSLRALATFIRKDRPDTMPHLLKLLDGLETGTFAAGRTGGRIDRAGNGELGSLTLRDLLTAVRLIADGVRSKNYTPGDMGTGFGLTTGEGGSRLEVDYLLVRRVATFLELLIREMRHVGGTLVLSGASGKVVRVEDKPSAWRVHFKTREDGTTVAHGFTVGAQARCQTYNRTSGNTYYWRLVTATGDDWVELSKSDYDHAAPTGTARTAPAVGDELVQLGHRTDSRQTGAIVLDTVGEGAPSIRLLTGIRSYSLTDANVRVLLSPSAVRVIADEVSFASGKSVEETITDSSSAAVTAAKDYFKEQKKEIDNSIGAVSGKVDNLVIGGRNLLINTQFTKRDSYQTVRGTYRIELDSVERYQGSNSLKLTNTKAGKIYEDVLVSGEQPAAGEYITVSLYVKAATAGTILSVRVCDNGEVQQTAALTTAWQRISFTFHALKAPSRAVGIWYDRAGTVWIALPKMEVGNKVTDWTPAPEDVDNSIAGVRNTANQASNDAGDAKQKAGEAATSAKIAETKAGEAAGSAKNAATSAGTAATKANEAAGSASEAKTQAANAAGSAQTAATNAAKAKADADAAKEAANASKEAADAAKTRLDSWAADNVISPMEKQGLRDETARIDADKSQVAAGYAKYGLGSYQAFTDAYNAYRAVLVTLSATKQETIAIPADFATKQRNYYTQRSTALTRIADAAKEYVDGLQIGGRNLVPGTSNDWKQYQLRSVTNLTIGMGDILTPGLMEGEYISMSMDIHWKGITVQGTPGAVTQSEGNVSGWFKGQLNHNFTTLITSNPHEGYARLTHVWKMTKDLAENEFFKYGFRFDNMSGMFEYRRLMVVRGQKPMDWQPAPEDWVTKINDAKSAGTAAADALNAYKKTVSETFHDGIIQEAEARAIEKYRNIVNSEFGALTNTYNAINGNAYLEGTAKSALANAFNVLRAAKDALITAVNNAISDKRVTEGEKQAVDAKYNAYQSAYAAYSAALEMANGSIHAKLKSLADKAANDIQVGGRNLIPDSDNGLLKRFVIHQPNNAPRYSTVDGWWRMAFDRDKQIVSRELTMTSVGTIQGLRKGNLAFSILCRTDGRIVPETLKISFFGGGQHRYVPTNIENCGNNTYRIWGVYMNYPASDLRVPDFMFFSTADATYVEFRYPKLEYGTKPTDWTPAPEDVTSEIAAKAEAARQAAQAEAIGLNKWIAQAYYTGKNNAATPPKLEDIVGKTPTRTVELKDAQFNVPGGNGSVFGMDYYTGIRTTYVYLDADYNLTTGIQHDGAGSLYVNGTLVASGGIQASSWKSVTLPLKRGWNRIDGLWNEGTGGDYFKFQAPLENDAHIIQLACRPNVNIDPMRAVTMQSVEEQKAGFNTFNKQFTAWSRSTETTLTEYNNELTKLTQRVTQAELDLTHDKIWMGISEKVTSTVDDRKTTLVSDLKSKTGIDIQQGVITLDAQKVKVQNGSQTMAMFEGGKLKADLIDADKIFSQDITVRNNATITNLRAKNAVIEGKLEAASGSTIGGMTGYSSYLGFETQRGTASERILHIGTQAIPLSTGFHGMLYLTDKQRDAFKTIVYIESLGKEEKRWNLADARAHNKAIHIASGTLRVDPGNLVDMPGVLLSGRVSETGYVEYEYGRRRMGMGLAAFSVQLHDGRDWVGYTITHNLGHTNYTVQATPYTPGWNWRKYMVHVDQLTANYFTLLCIDTGTDNRQVKGSFMFTVVGENTAD